MVWTLPRVKERHQKSVLTKKPLRLQWRFSTNLVFRYYAVLLHVIFMCWYVIP